MKIKTKLLIGFLSVTAIILIAGILGMIETNRLYQVSRNVGLKNAPLADAAMEIKLNAAMAHLWFEEIITEHHEKEMIEEVWQLLDNSLWYADAMLKGGENAEGIFYPVNDRVIEVKLFSVKSDIEAFIKMARLRFNNHFGTKKFEDHALHERFDSLFDKFIIQADEIEEILHAKMAQEAKLMEKTATRSLLILTIATVLGFLIATFAIYYLSRDIIKQVGGEPAEIAQLTQKVAAGNLDISFDTQKTPTGIYAAVQMMIQNLKTMNEEKEQQNWLKTGQTQLNDLMTGEQDILVLTKKIISFLTTYLDAELGLFYQVKVEQNAKYYLQIIASYAYTETDNRPRQFFIGEGLVGQAALEKKTILITQTSAECPPIIRSGLAGAKPHYVLLIPFFYDQTLKGVIEIGFHKSLTQKQRQFLEQVMPNIGIAVNTAESRKKLQTLLQQTQQQTEALQNQQEKLKHKQAELEQSNEELQSQSEELQTQQEELRQTNDELEARTRDLEEQKQAIHEQNMLLETAQTDMEKNKQAIEIKAKELELASQYKSEFLANMSHELRTPLNSMLILAQLLANNKQENLDEKQVEYAQTIYSAGSDLLTLINEILDLSKVEAGKISVTLEDVPLAELVSTMEQKFRPLAENKGLNFQIQVADDIPEILHTDWQRFQQIITNLLSNAFKFTEQGEIKLSFQYSELESLHSDDKKGLKPNIAISVTDTGIGIPKEKQQVIFEAFQQVDGSTSRLYGGTGLGLSISHQLAQLLGGELKVKSEVGQGSTFTLYLYEYSKSDHTSLIDDETENALNPFPKTVTTINSKPLTQTQEMINDDRNDLQADDNFILIIEDDHQFCHIIKQLALEKSFKCLIAEDGKTGLQLAETYQPHAIILDINLPQMDGWLVMERLKDNPKTRHIPVHFISASEMDRDAKKMGAIGYLLKPVSMEQLGDAFKKIERFIAKTVKKLLVLVDNEQQQEQIIELVKSQQVQTTLVKTKEAALQQLKMALFDCIILHIDVESALTLCEPIDHDKDFCQLPIIIYSHRELTQEEEALLQRYSDNLTLKAVKSPERLLDETTLFLHQVEANLPIEKRNMLQRVHDKEAILKGKKVLIVDDDIRNSFALTTFLEEKQMTVFIADHGKEALTLLDEEPDIALVLMDIMMPEMDGYEAMQKIRGQTRFRKLPIIALTAKAMKGDKAKCIDAGANDYLSKPVDMEQLTSLMRVWLYQ
jgi:signal transduction histidine kinase/CheY-like chemotaxis protein